MMKNIMKAAAIALAALTIASCTGKKFQVNGTISDAKDSLLYFENMSLQEGVVVLDSVKLGENGEFSFSEAAPEAPEFYRLRIANQIINISIDSTETVTVKASYPTMATQYEVEGSHNCQKIKELSLKQIDLLNRAIARFRRPCANTRPSALFQLRQSGAQRRHGHTPPARVQLRLSGV